MITKLTRFIFSPSIVQYTFCSKVETLKTYLEVIPPHRLYELREKKENRLQQALVNLQKGQLNQQQWEIQEQDLKIVAKEVKKRTNMIPLPVLTRIAQLSLRQQEGDYKLQLKQIYNKIVRTVKNKAEKLPVEQMVDMVYRLAKLNKREYELMKEVEKVILEERIKIDYPLIRKILFTYTHLNIGSSVLYSHISRTLTVGQYQFRPIELAESAYMLSKVSENAKGGYGVFAIAQKQLGSILPRLDFTQLVRASSFMLTQDLGSNKFQTQLEQSLYNTYPSKDRIKINDFVLLLKSTSGYFFKFKEGALLSMLKTTTLRMAKFATLEQFQDIVWSWGRLGKGDRQLWECLQLQIERRLMILKPRQIAFAYFSLCSSSNTSSQMLRRLQDKFLQFPLRQMNEHNLIKFLLGMHRIKLYQSQIFIKLSQIVANKIEQLSNHQFLNFLKVMNQSDLDFESKVQISGVISAIEKMSRKLENKLYALNLTQVSELLFLFVKFQIQNNNLLDKCFLSLENVINIPKSGFIKALFSFVIKDHYQKALECIPIVEQLIKYGPIGYFFSPHQFPLLAYCLFTIQVKGNNVDINSQLLKQTQEAMKQINPVILNDFVRKGYHEAIQLIQTYHNSQ